MAKIHMIEGPVGAGKTTYAVKLGHRLKTPPLILDDWMARLFRPDRPETDIWPWYAQRKSRCLEQIWTVAQGLLTTGNDAILELGLIQRHARLAFYDRIGAAGFDFSVYVLTAPVALRRARVRQRNQQKGSTFSMEVSADVFELADKIWEPPDASECQGRDIQFVQQTARD
jgi:predicted kinase